jgi:hypothetical protein
MKSIGPLYADVIQYYHRKALPIIEKGWTQETEFPYRKSKLCLVFRAPFTHPGFVLGIWTKPTTYVFDEDADDLLAAAIGLRDMNLEPEDVREW